LIAQAVRREGCAVIKLSFCCHVRRGLIFHVAARIAAVIAPLMMAAIGIVTASAAVAAQPIEQKASAKVASRDEVWRRRNWLRLACTRNQSWIAAAETVAVSYTL
jgi:hypothetical protein